MAAATPARCAPIVAMFVTRSTVTNASLHTYAQDGSYRATISAVKLVILSPIVHNILG